MEKIGVTFLLALAACSSSSEGEAPPFTCALGELRGTWQLTYVEKDGTCGPVAAETTVLTGESTAPSACQQDALIISEDKCRMDLDFTCPTNNGSQTWTGVTRHVAEGRMESTMTASVRVGGASCRSTYDITWTRQ